MASPVPAQPPGIHTISSPSPPWRPWRPAPPWSPWRPPPSRKNSMDNSSSQGGVIAGLVIGIMSSFLLFTIVWSTWKARHDSRSRAGAGPGTAPPLLPPPRPRDDDDQQLRRASASSQTALLLPAFMYNPSVKHNVTEDGEEAATCSVCLGAFQLGETVRLLPVCLHLYHVECIDPWLDTHSTCPLCRSDTDASTEMDVARLQPV